VSQKERLEEEVKKKPGGLVNKKEELKKNIVRPTTDKRPKSGKKPNLVQDTKSEEQSKPAKKESNKPAHKITSETKAEYKVKLEELRQKELHLKRKEEELFEREEELYKREQECKRREEQLKRREGELNEVRNDSTNADVEEEIQGQEHIDNSISSNDDHFSLEEGKKKEVENNAALGVGYFFAEDEVPPEIHKLVESFACYTDELVEEEKANPSLHKKVMLTKIEEESPEQDMPSKENTTSIEKVKKTLKNEKQIETSNLNPLSKPIQVKKQANLGASYDSATLSSAFGVIDLKSLCKSFAHAINRHIEFSQGKSTFSELQNNEEFTYKLGNMLKIDIRKKGELSLDKTKAILSESLAAMTGTKIKADLLSSYLTIEGDDEDIDLDYTKSNMGSILGLNPEKFVNSYKRSLSTLKACNERKQTLLRTQKNINIQGIDDVNKYLTIYNKAKISSRSLRRMSSDELARGEEDIDLESIDLSQKYTEPKEQKPLLKGTPAIGINVDEAASKQYLEAFSIFQLNYDFDTDQFIDLNTIPKEYLNPPTEKEIYKFCKKVLFFGRMEKEIPIIALIYIEKLILKTGLLMNALNWRRFTFLSLVLGSKVKNLLKQ